MDVPFPVLPVDKIFLYVQINGNIDVVGNTSYTISQSKSEQFWVLFFTHIFCRLPDSFTQLKNLQVLSINDISLIRLPQDVGRWVLIPTQYVWLTHHAGFCSQSHNYHLLQCDAMYLYVWGVCSAWVRLRESDMVWIPKVLVRPQPIKH